VKRICGVAVLALALLAGCGTNSSGTKPPDNSGSVNAAAVAAAVDTTAKAGTARIAINLTVTSTSANFPITGSGVFDYKRHLGQLTLALPPQLGGTLREVLTGKTLYLQIPTLGSKYYVLDLDEITGGTGTFSQLGNIDPTTALETLRGAAADVTKVGDATVRGARTTHYKGTLDLAKAAEKAPAALRARLRRQLQTLTSVPFDAYIDDEGRLRKMTNHIVLGSTGTVDSTVEMYDFGVPVAVRVPSKAQTTDGSALLRQLGGGAQ
jgi:hypothetical protein